MPMLFGRAAKASSSPLSFSKTLIRAKPLPERETFAVQLLPSMVAEISFSEVRTMLASLLLRVPVKVLLSADLSMVTSMAWTDFGEHLSRTLLFA